MNETDYPLLEDDELVGEFDVYISSELEDKLCIFQYPFLKNSLNDYHTLDSCRCKPNSNLIEFDLPLDTNSDYYNIEKGRAYYEDENMRDAYDEIEDDKIQEHQTITGKTIENRTNYYAGVFRGNELHLTKVNKVYQFRPTFKNLDDKLLKSKKEVEEKKINELRNVQLQAKKLNMTMLEASREILVSKFKALNEEPFQEVEYFNCGNEDSKEVLKGLFTENKQDILLKEDNKPYLELINTKVVDTQK